MRFIKIEKFKFSGIKLDIDDLLVVDDKDDDDENEGDVEKVGNIFLSHTVLHL